MSLLVGAAYCVSESEAKEMANANGRLLAPGLIQDLFGPTQKSNFNTFGVFRVFRVIGGSAL